LRWLLAALLVLLLALLPQRGRAQGVDLTALDLQRSEAGLVLDFAARLTLTRSLEDALQRGVPMYFTAQATVYRSRWYWRDERVARVNRSWRLSYQPLTSSWRVSLGGLSQTSASLNEALAVVSAIARWRVADAQALDPDQRYYVEFSYKLDTSQLPRPMQIGIGSEWSLGIERTLRVD
jgi:hypothetical protein